MSVRNPVQTAFWRLAAAAPLILMLPAAPAHARQPTAAERDSLKHVVNDFAAAMTASDMAKVVQALPPRVLAALAQQANVAPEALPGIVGKQMAAASSQVKITSFNLDVEHAKFLELGNGSPYALIPTETNMALGDQKVQAKSETLAVLDGAAWYLIRLEQPAQIQLFTQVYPEFADVKFTSGSMRATP